MIRYYDFTKRKIIFQKSEIMFVCGQTDQFIN